MALSPFHDMLLPLLRRSAARNEWTVAALRGPIAEGVGLIDAERAELLTRGSEGAGLVAFDFDRAKTRPRLRNRIEGRAMGNSQ